MQFSRAPNQPTQNHLCKLPSQHALTAAVPGEQSCLLYITDMMTKVRRLIDTGVDVGVLPTNSNDQQHKVVCNLQAVNGKSTVTYGKRYVYLKVCLHKLVHWILTVADVPMPIITIIFSPTRANRGL